MRSAWRRLKTRCQTCSRVTLSLGLLSIAGAVIALLMSAGAAGLAWTNTEAFCISCHELRVTVHTEFKGTIHDTNRSGVRAICSDCHVPREPGPMLVRKMRASLELWGHFRGVIDTPEKFEAHRATMAERVWTRMLNSDSQECRNCHHRESMSAELQSSRAQARHAKADREGMTCIECHFGIAHNEPQGTSPEALRQRLGIKRTLNQPSAGL
jgi:cytochrome c-type protein NapC